MRNKLMYVGVTHETASVEDRTYYAFNEEQKNALTNLISQELNIQAFTLVTTCNRTEIYFESDTVTPYELREKLVTYAESLNHQKLSQDVFLMFDHTVDTVAHLLHVANGLRSAVIGDKQIINQVKESYQRALSTGNQGSLLERAFQAVFRSHKRIATESLYQYGSTSTAYSSLKMAASYCKMENIDKPAILMLGAGEVAEDMLKYLSKFSFGEVAIANRTAEKAYRLSKRFGIRVYDWKKVKAGDFASFDLIITAVGNRKGLINAVKNSKKSRLWIDLAMPPNVNKIIMNHYNQVYDLDEVTSRVKATNDMQLRSIPVVEQILNEELKTFTDWLKKGKVRDFLRSCKAQAKQTFLRSFPSTQTEALSATELEDYAELLANRLIRKSVKTLTNLSDDDLPCQQIEWMNRLLTTSL